MAFTVYILFCFADDWGLLILPLVNGFHDGLRAVLISGWWRIAPSVKTRKMLPVLPVLP